MRLFIVITRYLLILILSIVIVWFFGNRFLDESPDIERIKFYDSQKEIPDKNNIAIGILGLHAPKGVDFIEHGISIKNRYIKNKSYDFIKSIKQENNALELTVNSEQVWCWTDFIVYRDDDECIPLNKADKVLLDNKEMLDRYNSILKLENYSGYYTHSYQTFLILLKMHLASIHIDISNQNYKQAYEKWKDQINMSRAMLEGQSNLVGKAVASVAFGFTYPLFEKIVEGDLSIVKDNYEELVLLLKPERIEGFNIDGIMRSEFSMLVNLFDHPPKSFGDNHLDKFNWFSSRLGQKERVLNRYYSFLKEYSYAINLPLHEQEIYKDKVKNKHPKLTDWDIIIDPFGSLLLTLIVDSQQKANELYNTFYTAIGRLRLANLFMDIIRNELSDDEISELLIKSENFYDPFINEPMKWDADKRTIYFPNKQNKCVPNATFHIPDKNHPADTENLNFDGC